MNNPELYNEFKHLSPTELNYQLLISCREGNLDKVKYLLTSPDLKYHADIHSYDDYYDPESDDSPVPHDECLVNACFNGHLDIVKYLLTSPDLSDHADIKTGEGLALINAAYKGHLNIVKYLLTSPELIEHAELGASNRSVIIHAYQGYNNHQNLELIDYLLCSPELKKHEDIHYDHDYIFKNSIFKKDIDFINFLIFKININITDEMQFYLNSKDNSHIINMFKVREMNRELEKELSCGIIYNKPNIKKI